MFLSYNLNSMPEKSLKNVVERVLEIVAHPTQILNNNFNGRIIATQKIIITLILHGMESLNYENCALESH